MSQFIEPCVENGFKDNNLLPEKSEKSKEDFTALMGLLLGQRQKPTILSGSTGKATKRKLPKKLTRPSAYEIK